VCGLEPDRTFLPPLLFGGGWTRQTTGAPMSDREPDGARPEPDAPMTTRSTDQPTPDTTDRTDDSVEEGGRPDKRRWLRRTLITIGC
jgi:hypothetical protein